MVDLFHQYFHLNRCLACLVLLCLFETLRVKGFNFFLKVTHHGVGNLASEVYVLSGLERSLLNAGEGFHEVYFKTCLDVDRTISMFFRVGSPGNLCALMAAHV